MAFTILDWQIIERIINDENNFDVGSIDRQRVI